ncbi:MAG TPA: alkaline phosphatase family protein [Armatimonadota bacterium]|nr:alkaline phosphatase family protein [Armatimonadota bacterium]
MLLIIGLDGASPEIVERLAAQGHLPTLRALMRHGVYGRLRSSPNCSPISAWASLLTGVNAGKHAAWGLSNLVSGSYDHRPPHSRMLRAPTLSQLLTERGLEAGTLFVPMTFPARESEWTTVSGWLCPSVDAEGFAWPARIADIARRALEGQPLDVDLSGHAASGRIDQALQEARAAMQAKRRLARELIGDRRWDMLAVNFIETDRVQRWLWHVTDRSHPAHRSDVHLRHADCIEQIYVEADQAVAELSGLLRPDDQLVVLSTYGMGVRSGAGSCVAGVLELLGMLQYFSAAGGARNRVARRLELLMDGACRGLHRLLPARLAAMLPECRDPADLPAQHERDTGIDYERSAALPAPGGHVYFNLEGQFPRGYVNQEVAARMASQINQALASAIDPANGRRPLESMLRREEVCAGPYLSRIPHLITRWRTDRVVTGLTVTARDGRVRVVEPVRPGLPSGAPAPEGIFIAAGAPLRRAVRIEGARLEDVTATAMHLCGERVPAYFDGRVLTEAISPGALAERPVRKLDRDLPKIIEDADRAARAASIVRAHLESRSYAD